LSGGAPNNILVLKRAIQKQQEKQYLDPSMYNSNKIIAAQTATDSYQNLGPGAYDQPTDFDVKKINK
jgi:hypothetical protein